MAGKVQIAASGFITEQLVGEPDFTYFNNFFPKHRHFAKETVKLKPDNEKDVQTGDHIEFTIPANSGDILNRLSISFSIPENLSEYNTSTEGNLLVDQFGISIFEYIDLYIGDQLLDRITSDDINIYNVTRAPSTYASTNDCIQGVKLNHGLSYWVNGQSMRTNEFKHSGGSYTLNTVFNNYIVDLPFYFHDRPKHGFPLCSIQFQELKIRVKLRHGREVIFPLRSVGSGQFDDWSYQNDHKTENIPLSNFKLNMDVIHLDTSERVKLRSMCKNILIEQNQHNTFTMERGIKSQSYRLDLKNCVKELYFIAKKKPKVLTSGEITILNTIAGSDITSYGSSALDEIFVGTKILQKPVPCIYMRQKHVTLTCDGIPILDETTGSHQFLSACIPNVYHKQTPIENNLTMYSFALRPDNMEPSGDLNFTMIKDATMQMTLSSDGSYGLYSIYNELLNSNASHIVHVEKDITIIAKSYNILRIKDGVGEILF
jgi:hypothetical protein